MTPRILVPGPARLDGYFRPYFDALRLAGGEPVRAWPSPDEPGDPEEASRCLADFQGLLLPGGADVEPRRYGEPPAPELGATDPELDEGQLSLARAALERALPILGICRGFQVLVVAAGGRLYQDLPSQRPSSVPHRVPEPKWALAHEVRVDSSSRLAALCGVGPFPVNSRHHQAVRMPEDGELAGSPGNTHLAPGPLRPTAWAPDGLVEGLEHPGRPFCVAVQWHPEDLMESRPEAGALLRGFVSACRHATCS